MSTLSLIYRKRRRDSLGVVEKWRLASSCIDSGFQPYPARPNALTYFSQLLMGKLVVREKMANLEENLAGGGSFSLEIAASMVYKELRLDIIYGRGKIAIESEFCRTRGQFEPAIWHLIAAPPYKG